MFSSLDFVLSIFENTGVGHLVLSYQVGKNNFCSTNTTVFITHSKLVDSCKRLCQMKWTIEDRVSQGSQL